ncbi:MAG: branched-chain amino acid ABC transporter substrate-binding protein [Actinomycetota bacterium]|nr:branched-chain amino acid ABC transporter substrate-binding protein [Actinomycetota bacterium]
MSSPATRFGRRRRAGWRLAALSVVASVGFASCGSATKSGDRIAGKTLTVYASVPLHGASSVNGQAVLDGATLALAQLHGRIGKYRLLLRPLDDSTAHRREWDPGQTTVNARVASADKTTIGYIGEFNSGASAISIPLLNRAGIPQISPASTAVGLTSGTGGADPGEPQKYYPTMIRTFARVVPSDSVEAAVQVKLQKSLGCTKTFVLDDNEVDGADTASSFSFAAHAAGLHVASVQAYDPVATDYTSLARSVATSGADCVLVSAITESHAALLTRELAAALPRARFFGTAGVAESTYTDPFQGGIPLALDRRVMVTVATLPRADYPAAGQAFYAAYTRRYGPPEPYAIFGYEAMGLLLDAIRRGTRDGRAPAVRSGVVTALFATRERSGAIGSYGIDRDGDTTLRRYGVYRIVDGRLSFWRAIST